MDLDACQRVFEMCIRDSLILLINNFDVFDRDSYVSLYVKNYKAVSYTHLWLVLTKKVFLVMTKYVQLLFPQQTVKTMLMYC